MDIQVTGALGEAQRAEWLAFLAQAEHGHPEQDPRFAEGWKARGIDVIYAMGRQEDELRAVAMFVTHPHGVLRGYYREAMPFSGPVCDDPRDMVAFLNGLEEHPPFNRIGVLKLTPYWLDADATALSAVLQAAGWHVFEPDIERTTGINDITGTPEEIVAGFSTNARRSLRKAERQNVKIEYVTDEAGAMEVFPLIHRHGANRFGEVMDTESYLADFRNVFATKDLGMLAVLRQEGRILGGVICYRSRDTVIYRKFFVDDDLVAAPGSVRVAPVLIPEAMKWGKALGCRYWDFDGYATGLDESHKYYRAFKYKDAFRPTVAQRIPGHEKVLRPALIRSSDLAEQARETVRPFVRILRERLGRPS